MYSLVIIDDDLFMLEYFKAAFNWNEMGFDVVAAFPSANDCLEYLDENHIDAIITDIRMPGMSGLELAKTCSTRFPDIYIIITSAYSDFEYAHQAIKYNVVDYCLKPIDDDDFYRAMNRLKACLNRSPNHGNPHSLYNDSNDTIKKALEYVDKHYNENINANDVAKHIMVSPNYFSSYFKKNTGEKFSLFLRRYRLEKACELLQSTNLKISCIAEKIGYKSFTHFYGLFYEQYGITPAEYRKQSRQ